MKSFALLLLLIILVSVDFSSNETCRSLPFWKKDNGNSSCGLKEYLRGFYRDANQGKKDVIDLLRNASCCTGPPPVENSERHCTTIRMWRELNQYVY